MSSRWYLRITLYTFVVLLLVLWGAGLEFTFFTGALVGLAVALASTALASFIRPEDVQFGLSLAYLFAVAIFVERAISFGVNGWVAVGAGLLLSLLGVAVFVYVRNRRMRSGLLANRTASRDEHLAHVRERQQLAEREGLNYEERSAALAVGFGRVEQEVPDNLLSSSSVPMGEWVQKAQDYERMEVLAKHAAGLEAVSVIRAQVGEFPVTMFELELISTSVMAAVGLTGVNDIRTAAEISKRYLSVGMVTLPFPLPFVSSAYAYELGGSRFLPSYGDDDVDSDAAFAVSNGMSWDSPDLKRRRTALMTENEELARLLMSVPAISRTALIPSVLPPWFIDGDRLVSSDLTKSGVPAAMVQQWISALGTLVAAFPWSELQRFRTDSPAQQTARNQRFFRTFRPGPEPGAELERWETQHGESGLLLLRRTHQLAWSASRGARSPVEA